ncbi:hypothetical protein [Myroides indicus]|uniref:Uncharacterized protein n=1 Tax=Myroides indicus TaxID=1323422 RepID=A0A4R7ESR5_9FLAO|nr:hypothetical protein [Myroides indicus]TDS55238.1 hypothetical protein C8P70_1239 [Myroides indicus]
MSTYFGNAAFAAQAGMHGISGGIMSEIEGGKFISGLASGAVSSLVGSAISSTGNIKMKGGGLFKDSPYFAATMYASGGLSGGLSSSIAGGNFWSGMRQGVITTGLNHLMHMAVPKDQDPPADKVNSRKGGQKEYGDFSIEKLLLDIEKNAQNSGYNHFVDWFKNNDFAGGLGGFKIWGGGYEDSGSGHNIQGKHKSIDASDMIGINGAGAKTDRGILGLFQYFSTAFGLWTNNQNKPIIIRQNNDTIFVKSKNPMGITSPGYILKKDKNEK